PAQAGAAAAIEDSAYFEDKRAQLMRIREQLAAQLRALDFEVLDSATNFLFVRHARRQAAELALALRERAILVRHFRLPRIDNYLRISIGTEEECGKLHAALSALLAGA
ncbi:MAG: aminotransferase class I/II-fold pyridoxal phosphate-dependent enzyme, partial [Massilia sp.]